MEISAVSQEINEWSGSVLIAGVLEGRIESQINLFKTIIKDTYLSQRFNDAKFKGEKSQKLSIELIEGNIKKVSRGPVVTLNEFEPAAGIKVSKIINLSEDIARNCHAHPTFSESIKEAALSVEKRQIHS